MIYYLTDAQYLGEGRFHVRFNTGDEGDVDLREVLANTPDKYSQLFESDPKAIGDFYLDAWPTLAWKCGYDIAPERLYELFADQRLKRVAETRSEYRTSADQ